MSVFTNCLPIEASLRVMDLFMLVRAGAENALLLNHLDSSDLDINWISRPDTADSIHYDGSLLDD